jgi:NADH-quinone oxidoreductase subunit D
MSELKINQNGQLTSLDTVDGEIATLNLGPTHPATHGIFQNILKVDGERIISAEPTVGYIHRAFEKLAERRPYQQVTPITDRLNYCSSPINNMGWHLTVEKLIGAEIPKRVDYMRVIVMELARIADHLVCNSVIGVDTGALTGFTYVFQEREKIYDLIEEICGARLTTNVGRIGGCAIYHQSLNNISHAPASSLKELLKGAKMYVIYKKKTKVKPVAKYRVRFFLKYLIVLIIFIY